MNETNNTVPAAIHPFEKSGLGKAPFRVVGFTVESYQPDPRIPARPAASCNYCFTDIMNVFHIKSADGRRFKVGCDCVERTVQECANTDAERAARSLWEQCRKVRLAAEHKKADSRIAAAVALLDSHREELESIAYTDGKFPQSVARWADWMIAKAGRKGKMDAARRIESIAKERGWI